jgi:DNA-directed RNA polymerase specialized sigma24 family protein
MNVDLDEADESTLAPQSDPEGDMMNRLVLEEVDDTIRASFSPRDQEIFWMYFLQDFTARQIAKIPSYGLTEKGVESVIQRVKRHVWAQLAERRPIDKKGNLDHPSLSQGEGQS